MLAPLLGLVLLALLLWGAVALAWAWGRVSLLLFVDVEARLAAQVDALSLETVRREDAIALERRVLQRNLHDGAQMHLSAAAMRLGMLELDAETLPAGPGRTRVLEGLEAVREQLDLGAQSVRDAAAGLVPLALRDGGLCPTLREAAAALPLACEVSCDVPRLRESVEQSLFLVASEALTNVVRHAEASRVRIRCALDDGGRALALEIADDGCGGAEPTGTGLVGIAARVRGLGGTLAVSSPEGGPTALRVRMPLEGVRAGEGEA
ncbi:histidine kinase [Brachybacterium huguangmaarense]|uniref:histidine kinase n=1 Tax=Brachybacterium huguangmaarense TaxID=1652028 RepID=A0ABY6G3M8_9MICO|nr:ATP-binding protein [Brachybacterium huguangmaarense]UYG17712.1 histidine kinase [Brachybacterium huguangmaarense]